MIAYLQGDIILKKEKFVILEIQGIGYKVFLSQKNLEKISDQEKFLKVFCFLFVRENVLDLYGFLSLKEQELFEILINISGVGPKASLEISSLGPLEKLKKSIEQGDGEILKGILGIGRKKAKKILLELSGKIKDFESPNKKEKILDDPAFDALVNLGFSKQDVREVIAKIPKETNTETKIKQALKMLGR